MVVVTAAVATAAAAAPAAVAEYVVAAAGAVAAVAADPRTHGRLYTCHLREPLLLAIANAFLFRSPKLGIAGEF